MESSSWHRTLVYFGYRDEGQSLQPTEEDRAVLRARRLTALGAVAMLVVLLALAIVP
jgi:hypothetical protein